MATAIPSTSLMAMAHPVKTTVFQIAALNCGQAMT
jgi:hypothetical protein